MSTSDWENVARCAMERYVAHRRRERKLGEWESWHPAQALSGRCPF